MKDILRRKPSIAELTGISKSRLDCFATHLRTYLVGGNTREIPVCSASSNGTILDLSDTTSTSSKTLRSRHIGSQAVKPNSPYQGSLSPRSSSFKEGLPRSLSSLRNVAREKLRRRGDTHLSAVDDFMVASHSNDASSSNQYEIEKLQEVKNCPLAPSSFLESLGKLAVPPSLSPVSCVSCTSPPLFSPYYCWCPQGASILQYPSSPSAPTSSTEQPLLPPFPSILSATMSSSLLTPAPSLTLADVPSLDFPALLPDPLVRLPMPSSQQIPTFTPLICDPIVHIPVIDVCSSGQGYLVSAGPTISSTIPPLHPKLVNPLIPEPDSMMEKGARETLRLLISSSSQVNPQLMDVLPAVLMNTDEKKSVLATGSRSLYTGTKDVDVIANSIATMGLVSLSGSSMGNGDAKASGNSDDPDVMPEGASSLGGSCSDNAVSNMRKRGTN